MTTPSATTASHVRASACATTGNSTEPETCATTTSVTWHALAAARARSSICSVRSACQRVTAMPSRSPDASTVYSFGEPKPAIVASPPLHRAAGDLVQLVEEVSHPVALRPQVMHVLVVYPHRHRLATGDLEPVPFEPGPLRGVVRQQAHAAHAEVVQDLGAGAVVARICRQAQVEIRVHGVSAGVLQLVRLQLVQQSDAAALVPAYVKDDASTLGRNAPERGLQLRAAVAPHRAEDIAGQALGVHAHEHVSAITEIADDERDVLGAVVRRLVPVRREHAVVGGQSCLGDALDLLLGAAA